MTMPVRPYLSLPRPWLIAHRGGAELAPENTFVALDQGVQHGAVCLEIDVRRTRDGAVVVFHDDDTTRVTGMPGTIEERSLVEVQRLDAGYRFSRDGGRTFPYRARSIAIPTLRDVLARYPSMRFNIEAKTKDEALAEAFVSVVHAARAEHRVCIGSAIDAQGERLRALLPEACHFLPRNAAARHLLTARVGGLFDGLCPDGWDVADVPTHAGSLALLGEGVVARLHARGLAVFVWTIDEEDEMRAVLAMGVDGVMTDRPDRLARVLAERAGLARDPGAAR